MDQTRDLYLIIVIILKLAVLPPKCSVLNVTLLRLYFPDSHREDLQHSKERRFSLFCAVAVPLLC